MTPGRGLVRLLLIWLALGIAASAWPALGPVWWAFAAVIIAVVVAAFVEVRRPPELEIERTVPSALPLGEWSDVRLHLHDPSGHALSIEVFDHYPVSAELQGLPLTVVVPAHGWVEHAYRIRPRRRGEARFGRTEIRRRSRGDVLRRRFHLGDAGAVRVLPNFRPVLRQGLAGQEDPMRELGVHLQRRRGEGLEFQELRDYRAGDSLRQVDWKATARRGKLISRQYEDERNQQVMLLIDNGRRMHAREGDLTHFDHVLNAVLLLAYVAMRQGDAVGVASFGGEERWLPPVKGPAALGLVLDTVHDLQTSTEPSDYHAVATRVMERQRRRALVLLLTNLRDEDTEDVLPALATLRRRHLVVLGSTRERALRELTEQRVAGFEQALEVASAHHYLAARARAHERLVGAGALTLDVEPQELPSAIVSRYLEIKRAGQL